MYRALGATQVAKFLPELRSVKDSDGGRAIIELQDLTFGVEDPCLMDVKMGERTFTEDDAEQAEPRADLLQKMLKVQSDAATPEELEQGFISKMRYLQFREQSTTSRTLGFRVDAVQLAEGVEAAVPDTAELKTITTREQVSRAIGQYAQLRPQLIDSFLAQLIEVREVLQKCECFMGHSMIRTSLLFVYSSVTNQTQVAMIDFPRAASMGRITHREPWQPGNHEDGYLNGVDNLISIFEAIRRDIGGS